MKRVMALFGEAEKGQFHTPYVFHSLLELAETLGNPPEDSVGLSLSIQAILYNRALMFFRVEEEGFSLDDYYWGLRYLKNQQTTLNAICIPKVSDPTIIKETTYLCHKNKSLILITEKDFYDYLTSIFY